MTMLCTDRAYLESSWNKIHCIVSCKESFFLIWSLKENRIYLEQHINKSPAGNSNVDEEPLPMNMEGFFKAWHRLEKKETQQVEEIWFGTPTCVVTLVGRSSPHEERFGTLWCLWWLKCNKKCGFRGHCVVAQSVATALWFEHHHKNRGPSGQGACWGRGEE